MNERAMSVVGSSRVVYICLCLLTMDKQTEEENHQFISVDVRYTMNVHYTTHTMDMLNMIICLESNKGSTLITQYLFIYSSSFSSFLILYIFCTAASTICASFKLFVR